MKKGDRLTVEIVDMGASGEGVAKVEGIPVFVPFAITGERVSIELVHCKKNYAFADLIDVLSSSNDRINPRCVHFGTCGGCDLQHLSYQKQLEIKRASVVNNLRKIAKIDCEVGDVVYGKQWCYRNKLSLPFGLKDGKVVVGFFEKRSHNIVPMKECPLHSDWAIDLIWCLTSWANEAKISVYDERKQTGFLRHSVARMLDTLSLTIVGNGKALPSLDLLVKKLEIKFENFEVYFSSNTKNTNVILGKSAQLVFNTPQKQTLGALKAEVSPMSFLQVNNEIRDKIYEYVCTAIEHNSSQAFAENSEASAENDKSLNEIQIVELYSGVGILTAELALRLPNAKITAVEIVPEATADANRLMAENNLSDRVTNVCADAAQTLKDIASKGMQNSADTDYAENCIKNETRNVANLLGKSPQNKTVSQNKQSVQDGKTSADLTKEGRENEPFSRLGQNSIKSENTTVILDPPRKGCDALVLEAIRKFAPAHIVYISCNSATLARDLKILAPDFVPTSITPFDMFPQTKHLETLVCLTRKP